MLFFFIIACCYIVFPNDSCLYIMLQGFPKLWFKFFISCFVHKVPLCYKNPPCINCLYSICSQHNPGYSQYDTISWSCRKLSILSTDCVHMKFLWCFVQLCYCFLCSQLLFTSAGLLTTTMLQQPMAQTALRPFPVTLWTTMHRMLPHTLLPTQW